MITQGCIEVTAQTLQSPELIVPSGTTPVHAVVAVHQGPAWRERERKIAPGVVAIVGTDLKIQTRGLRPGDCVCWTAYDA
jgi:hypothetical protein